MIRFWRGGGVAVMCALIGLVMLCGATAALGATVSYAVGAISNLSATCSGQNAEVEQAVDSRLGYVYESWMGCNGIAFARSTDGGRSFATPVSIPGSVGSNVNSWDPAVAVAPDGTVYAAFMLYLGLRPRPHVGDAHLQLRWELRVRDR